MSYFRHKKPKLISASTCNLKILNLHIFPFRQRISIHFAMSKLGEKCFCKINISKFKEMSAIHEF